MKRLAPLLCAVVSILVPSVFAGVASADGYNESLCQQRPVLCRDPATSIGENGEYTGHDEPSVGFVSNRPGTGGRDLTYTLTLPRNPPVRPNNAGTAGTWDFQLRATFWIGLTLCDSESSPNFTKTCVPNSDDNARFRSTDPQSPNYLGRSPGNAFMELQFYEPGWVPQFDGFGCSATKWCANLTIDSLSDNANTGVPQNSDCLDNHFLVGEEPINWAYITKDGKSQAPANPLALSDDPTFKGLNPDLTKDLLMNPGDTIRVFMHDTPAGYRIDINDLSTGGHGSMTASIANGFGQVLYEPDATQCHVRPYAFHPMYDSAVPRGNTWAAHTTNVSVSDEIGHFENCRQIDPATGTCLQAAGADPTVDVDDQFCLNGADFGALIPINGCLLDDGDFDGTSYRFNWPGTFRNPFLDRLLHPTPMRFTVPTSGGRALEQTAFETDLPRIERGDEPGNPLPGCDAHTGANCVNPPPGAQFYPLYTATRVHGTCMLQQGGPFIPGTVNDFGGTSKSEYGDLLFVDYASAGFTVDTRAQDFRRELRGSPCGRR